MIWFSDKYFENYILGGGYFGAFKLCHGSGSQCSIKNLKQNKTKQKQKQTSKKNNYIFTDLLDFPYKLS